RGAAGGGHGEPPGLLRGGEVAPLPGHARTSSEADSSSGRPPPRRAVTRSPAAKPRPDPRRPRRPRAGGPRPPPPVGKPLQAARGGGTVGGRSGRDVLPRN